MSNTERQRQFRERNPGYYARLHARRRAGVNALVAETVAMAQVVVLRREPLMLPAPVETIEIQGVNTISSIREMAARLKERVPTV